MADPLTMRLLGVPQFSVATTPIVCTSKKSLALFAYLVLTRRTHTRHELAALLWGRRDFDAARTSLRVALHRLPAALARCLHVDRESIGLTKDMAAVVDVVEFETLAAKDTLDSLESAAVLYSDELLKDFDATASPEFDDWLHAQRVRLAQLAQRVFDGIIARRADRARHDVASATVERESALAIGLRWTELMPASEAAHRWLIQLYLDMGRRDAALAQYELCQRALAVTHGRAPSPETRALQQAAIAGGHASASTPVPPAAHGDERSTQSTLDASGIASTSFVGRIEELAELDALLADPACRLITLHGLGGSGKTRLAHALATQVGSRFSHGATWISLESAASPDALPQAIADALGRELPAHGDRAAAIAEMLVSQRRLLILDNFETLMAGEDDAPAREAIGAVLTILSVAPGVRIVVTSRTVLGVQEEWIYELRGLPHRNESGAVHVAQLAGVDLFAQRARQAYLGFSLSAEMPHVLRICALVEGLPLGIELAAAWVRTVPCADIASAIEAAAAALVSPHRNRPHRHQSLEAVVACSWNLLRDEQREALAGLGAFVGGFTRETAETIADAPLRTLSALADKALVRRRAEGRFDLHEIVRQFALARLRSTRARHALVAKRHGEYFAQLLLRLAADLRSPAEVAADTMLRQELANIQAAWRRAIDASSIDIVERMAAPLVAVLQTRGRIPEAIAEAERAAALLGKQPGHRVPSLLRLQWGRAAIGNARQISRRELEGAREDSRTASPDVVARHLYYLAALEYREGNLDRAEAISDEAFELAHDSADAEVRMLVHNLKGSLANLRSRFEPAQELLAAGLEAARALGAPSAIGGMLCSLAVPLTYIGRFDDAAALNAEALSLYQRLGRNATMGNIHSNLASIECARGNVSQAIEHGRAAVLMARDAGDEQALSHALVNLGEALDADGQRREARAALDEAARIAADEPLTLTETLHLLARIDIRERALDAALARILQLRDVLAAHRLEIRVPTLALATAEYVLATDARRAGEAAQWLQALASLEGVDATLRLKARRLLDARQAPEGARITASAALSSRDIEQAVLAFLASASGTR